MTKLRAISVITSFGLVATAACATPGAVPLENMRPGETLRVTYAPPTDDVVTYQLMRMIDGSLEVAADTASDPYRVRLIEVDRLHLLRGRATRRSATFGGSMGALGGIVAGMICFAACPETESGKRILAPAVGFAIGAPLGAAAGAMLAPPQWLEVRTR
jgi:hypothetical protein